MKLVDSRKQQLDYAQILHVYHAGEKHSDKRLDDFTVWMAALAAGIGKMNAEGMIIGNTFFLYKRGSGENSNKAMVWAMNADTLQNMVDNVTEFLTRATKEGITGIVSIYHSPAITRVVRQAFQRIKPDGDDIKVVKTAQGRIVLQMQLDGGNDV